MARKIAETKEYFVPAKALEHHTNPENFNRDQKILAAVQRFHINGDFEQLITVKDNMPSIFVEEYRFNKDRMGYDVVAIIFV